MTHLERGVQSSKKRPVVDAAPSDDKQNDGEVETAKAVALYQKRKKRNAVKNVLSRQVCSCPALLDSVTGSSDGNPNKYHCSYCNQNISILTKGLKEPLRHFLCATHLRRDQRYHLTEHHFIYELIGVDTIPANDLSEEDRNIMI